MNDIKIYRIRMGSLGEYVFCACSYKSLYGYIYADDHMKWEILRNKENTGFMGFKQFMYNWKKFITEEPLHLGYLGGYSE